MYYFTDLLWRRILSYLQDYKETHRRKRTRALSGRADVYPRATTLLDAVSTVEVLCSVGALPPAPVSFFWQ